MSQRTLLPRVARFVWAAGQPVGQGSGRSGRVREGLRVDRGPASQNIHVAALPVDELVYSSYA